MANGSGGGGRNIHNHEGEGKEIDNVSLASSVSIEITEGPEGASNAGSPARISNHRADGVSLGPEPGLESGTGLAPARRVNPITSAVSYACNALRSAGRYIQPALPSLIAAAIAESAIQLGPAGFAGLAIGSSVAVGCGFCCSDNDGFGIFAGLCTGVWFGLNAWLVPPVYETQIAHGTSDGVAQASIAGGAAALVLMTQAVGKAVDYCCCRPSEPSNPGQ